MRCPYCKSAMVMDGMDHGICPKCKTLCGCSFDPTSLNDYCDYHKPKFKQGNHLYSQSEIDEAKEIAALNTQIAAPNTHRS